MESPIDSLIRLSENSWNVSGPFDKNEKWLWQAEKISREYRNYEKQTECLIRLSAVYFYAENSLAYSQVVDSSYNVARRNLDPDHAFFQYIYGDLSEVYRKMKHYAKAIEYCKKGIEACANCNISYLSNFQISIAKNFISLGDYSKARQYLDAALSLDYENIRSHCFQKYRAHYIYSILYWELDNSLDMIINLQKSEYYLSKFYKKQDQNELLTLWIHLVEQNIEIGNFKDADIYIKKIEEKEFLDDFLNTGKYKVAKAKYLKAVDGNIGTQSIDLIMEGIELLSKAETVDVSLDLKISQNLELAGDLYLEGHNDTLALESYYQSLQNLGFHKDIKDLALIANKPIVIRLLSKITKIYTKRNQIEKSERLENSIIELLAILRTESSDASTKEYWAQENLRLMEDIISSNFERGDHSKAIVLLEENKSNLLLKDINENESAGFANIDSDVIQEGKNLKYELAYYDKQIRNFSNNDDTTNLSQLIIERNSLQLDYDRHLKNIEEQYPEYYNLKYNLEPINVSSLQNELDGGDLLVEYFIGEEKGYVALVSHKTINIFELTDIEQIKEHSLNYYQSISRNTEGSNSGDAKKLFEALGLSKITKTAPDTENLIIVGDDFLNNIPFGLLQDADGTFLIDKYNVQYQYSARLWQMLMSRKSEKKKHDFVGYAYSNPDARVLAQRSCVDITPANLKCAGREIRSVIDILDSDKVWNADSTLDHLMDNAAEAKIVHLATHACLDDENSDYSRIYFNDTLLTNQDLKIKDISADMVVLSACETGFGEIIKGEGSISLSKGFFHAGAKSTLVSLWSVDDCATTDLMQYFYQNLKEGQTKDAALRNAKLEYRSSVSADKAHPYYWAGFIVIGDCAPIWNTGLSMVYYCGIALFIICGLFLFYIFRKTSKK